MRNIVVSIEKWISVLTTSASTLLFFRITWIVMEATKHFKNGVTYFTIFDFLSILLNS